MDAKCSVNSWPAQESCVDAAVKSKMVKTIKLQVNCPCALTKHHAMKAYLRSAGIAPLILWPRH